MTRSGITAGTVWKVIAGAGEFRWVWWIKSGNTRSVRKVTSDHGGGHGQFSFTRSFESHCDMSERMTLSPGWRPLMISIVLTELRPSVTRVRVA
ncbi:MAG: hypothetical protein JWM88_3523 [Verrucomicrobia bacterium]|nr:hypothetical protein [Verrucomicrobiota bacterium]